MKMMHLLGWYDRNNMRVTSQILHFSVFYLFLTLIHQDQPSSIVFLFKVFFHQKCTTRETPFPNIPPNFASNFSDATTIPIRISLIFNQQYLGNYLSQIHIYCGRDNIVDVTILWTWQYCGPEIAGFDNLSRLSAGIYCGRDNENYIVWLARMIKLMFLCNIVQGIP